MSRPITCGAGPDRRAVLRAAAAGLAGLALPGALTHPLGAATALVTFALEAGGADNVTVVLAPFPPRAPKSGEKSASPATT